MPDLDLAAIEARLAAATPTDDDRFLLDGGEPRTDVYRLCHGCGSWTPRGHPEAHDHRDECSAVTAAERLRSARAALFVLADIAALVAEVRRLREAAAAPLVHLAAGQVAVWPWIERRPDHGAMATDIGGRWMMSATSHDWMAQQVNGPVGAGGTAPDLDSAKAAAIAAVVEMARRDASDAR